jgi:hypothetical protein
MHSWSGARFELASGDAGHSHDPSRRVHASIKEDRHSTTPVARAPERAPVQALVSSVTLPDVARHLLKFGRRCALANAPLA